MTKKPFAAALLAALAVAGAFIAFARKAHAQERPAGRLELVAEDRDTAVYFFRHESRACYIATTRGGSGISLQCVK